MIASRLVRLIETHSEQLANALTAKLESSAKLGDFRKVPQGEMKQRAYEIYHNLSDWLLTKTEADIEKKYTAIGERRASQGVALSSVIWALLMTEELLWEFVKREGLVDRQVELFQELELMQLVDQFFDRAVYYAARGYEKARAEHPAELTAAH